MRAGIATRSLPLTLSAESRNHFPRLGRTSTGTTSLVSAIVSSLRSSWPQLEVRVPFSTVGIAAVAHFERAIVSGDPVIVQVLESHSVPWPDPRLQKRLGLQERWQAGPFRGAMLGASNESGGGSEDHHHRARLREFERYELVVLD